MQRTIFTTPGINTVLRALSRGFLHLAGWQLAGAPPTDSPKCVLIAAPHTSNWDLPYTLMVAFALRLNIRWMGKHQIFRWPFGALMRWLGGIAVDRTQSTNFYWIAHEAGVPIVMAYMDHPRKLSGLGPVFMPSGDIATDMVTIKAYYAQYKGKHGSSSAPSEHAQRSKSNRVRATTLVARRRSSSTRCSSARLAWLSSTVRGPAP